MKGKEVKELTQDHYLDHVLVIKSQFAQIQEPCISPLDYTVSLNTKTLYSTIASLASRPWS